MSRNPHRRPTVGNRASGGKIDYGQHGRIGGEYKEGRPDGPAMDALAKFVIFILSALISTSAIWAIVALWKSILSMM